MPLLQNPDEYFSKPLTVYPMTNPTPHTPEPPAAGELNDERLLQIAEKELGIDDATEAHEDGYPIEVTTVDLITYARAAISADRARRPQAEQMAEALRRLRRWGGLHGWDGQVRQDVFSWIDAGMTGPLPPLPEYIARLAALEPPADETTTTTNEP